MYLVQLLFLKKTGSHGHLVNKGFVGSNWPENIVVYCCVLLGVLEQYAPCHSILKSSFNIFFMVLGVIQDVFKVLMEGLNEVTDS